MQGMRVAASLLLGWSMIGCASGASEREIEAAAAAFGDTGDIERRGGHWTGVAEPPQIFDEAIELRPGRPLISIDRSAEFPVVRDLQLRGRGWEQRGQLDLDLVDEVRAGGSSWTVLAGDPGELVRSALAAPLEDGAPVGDLSAPEPERVEHRIPLTIGSSARLVASDSIAAIHEPANGTVTIVRAAPDGTLTSVTVPSDAARLCAIEDMFGTAALTSSADPTGSSCEQLSILAAEATSLAPLAGDLIGVVGVGFAEGLPLVVSRADACVARPCALGASLLGPDGAVVRDLGTLDLADRDRAIVGSVAGVPIVFGGDNRFDGTMFDATTDTWVPMKPYPLGQEGIVEQSRVLLTDTHLVMTTRNAVGLWAPAGEGSSWTAEDLYRWPLYVATDDTCLNLRAQPGLESHVLRCVDRGVQFFADGAHAVIDEIRWVSVLLPGLGLRGWVAEQFLSGVSPDDPSEFACGAR